MTREEYIKFIDINACGLRRFLMALCNGDSAKADDIAQDTLLKSYLAIDTFKKPEKFKAWIFSIAYRNFLNSKRRERKIENTDSLLNEAVKEEQDDKFRYERLYNALQNLNETERTTILLFYMEGYSTKEISGITGEKEATVRKHLSRGRSRLKLLLENEDKD